MSLIEMFLIAIGLSMDAFAVAIGKGLGLDRTSGLKTALVVGLYFGVFQAGMPFIGFLAGAAFADKIEAFDHWLAFLLLAFIGAKMIKESFEKDERDVASLSSLAPKTMLPLAVATSIDALAAGVSFAFLDVDILPAISLIGATTFTFGGAGVAIGAALGSRFKSYAGLAGGVILVLMGIKTLLEHFGVFA